MTYNEQEQDKIYKLVMFSSVVFVDAYKNADNSDFVLCNLEL